MNPDPKPEGFISNDLKILEYKYSINGLITDLTTGDKKANDIDLLVAWEAGEKYKEEYGLRSLLMEDARATRDYHGITHVLLDSKGNVVMDVILLKDLISFLNNSEEELKLQDLYEE
ncbi:MAG: hypothetical protein CMM86_14150 [Rhodovulum sp.]|nr:hypothetical protein [Rhodovulum sp.]|tara:strand:+ start:31 stop:381 length:351 start_codon:yes stop_codon:yes gene_type:complete